MSNLIDITDLTDAELDALLAGDFAASAVETEAGGEAMARAAEKVGRETGMVAHCATVARNCRDAGRNIAGKAVTSATRCANAAKAASANVIEGAVLAREEREFARA